MPAQGTSHRSLLAVWLNRVGMTSREFKRRLGDNSASRLSDLLCGNLVPGLAMAYEIERITEGGVPMESWMSSRMARKVLKTMRDRQPPEYLPKKEQLLGEADAEVEGEE